MQDDLIYLDYNATTPLDPRVLEAFRPYLEDSFGNAASRHHRLGLQAGEAVDRARVQVAAVIGADPREIFWTSGATESNNLALKGLAASPVYKNRRHMVTVLTEHRAVLDPCRHLQEQGFEVTFLKVDSAGRLDLADLHRALRDDTLVVSIMHGNNEIGVIHPIAEIGQLCRTRGVLFHTDATQSFGKEEIDVNSSCIDLLSFSAHKACGPKGVGGLFVRRRRPRVRCEALIHGGGHERGLRSGTLNVPGIVGLGAAAELCRTEWQSERSRVRALRDRLQDGLVSAIEGTVVNGAGEPRLAGTLNVSFPGVEADPLLERLPDLALSTASACTSAAMQPSYVLGALGLSEELILASIRFSLGRFTTEGEVDRAVEMMVAGVAAERAARA
jgi:cysteine desulfurase